MQKLKKKICIIDYSLGNIFSIQNALNYLGFDSYVSKEKYKILQADGIILPGVGSFNYAMKQISASGLNETLLEYNLLNKPFLGTCLGMQLLFETSDEFNKTDGLGILKGKVIKLPRQKNLSLNMNWSKIKLNEKNNFKKKANGDLFNDNFFYFIHSFHVSCDEDLVHSTSFFGNHEFISSISYKNIFGTQFHLEKSGQAGLNVLKQFFQQDV